MKLLKFAVDVERLNLDESGQELFLKTGMKTVFENAMNQALSARYREGVTGSKQRIYARILDKLDLASGETIALEEAEFDLVKEIFGDENARFHPAQTRLVMQYLASIENAKQCEA